MHLMFAALGLVSVGCIDPVAARWQLDHDHVIAARATPPRIMPGETATLDALVAHDGALTTIEAPSIAAAPLAPAELQAMVVHEGAAWLVRAPDAEELESSRPRMGLPANAAVPVEVVMAFDHPGTDPFYVKKTVWLGDRAEHPVVPALTVDGQPAGATIDVARERDIYISVPAAPGIRVSWLTSCGELFQDDVATAFLRVAEDAVCDGELAVVLRADDGGVAWQVWPIRAL